MQLLSLTPKTVGAVLPKSLISKAFIYKKAFDGISKIGIDRIGLWGDRRRGETPLKLYCCRSREVRRGPGLVLKK